MPSVVLGLRIHKWINQRGFQPHHDSSPERDMGTRRASAVRRSSAACISEQSTRELYKCYLIKILSKKESNWQRKGNSECHRSTYEGNQNHLRRSQRLPWRRKVSEEKYSRPREGHMQTLEEKHRAQPVTELRAVQGLLLRGHKQQIKKRQICIGIGD